MKNKNIFTRLTVVLLSLAVLTACFPKIKGTKGKDENKDMPSGYTVSVDANSQIKVNTDTTSNIGKIEWRDFFKDKNLDALIDSALKNNQELNIMTQEIAIANNEVMARRGEYLPNLGIGAGAGVDKVGRYTTRGAAEDAIDIAPGKATPEVVPDMMFGAFGSWEVDIWHKMRNAKKAAFNRYAASIEGRKFMVTNMVAEIASSYYELLALDNQLAIVKQNIQIQSNALEIVRQEKDAARVTELAVRKFEAEVYHTRSLQYDIQQQIVEAENRINFLVGRFPQPVVRDSVSFTKLPSDTLAGGVPSQLLANRMDIRQAELNLIATKLDVKSARAQFYPSLNIRAGIGFQAFNPTFLVKPESLLFTLAGDLMAPLVNRAGIKAAYFNANSKQIQAAYLYEQKILNGYTEVANQLANINNLKQSYALKKLQVDALNESIIISTNLFTSARADYMEVLLTQRDALSSKFELIETQKQLLQAKVKMYRALGGGWQ